MRPENLTLKVKFLFKKIFAAFLKLDKKSQILKAQLLDGRQKKIFSQLLSAALSQLLQKM